MTSRLDLGATAVDHDDVELHDDIPINASIAGRPRVESRARELSLGPAIPVLDSSSPEARAVSLSSGDFDTDGVADLVWLEATSGGRALVLMRGNPEAVLAPVSSPVASPFLEPARRWPAPRSADMLAVGDFDNDGHLDVVVAEAGRPTLHIFLGDGRGGFRSVTGRALAGEITALVAGEVNRADGLADLVLGVDGPEGPSVVVLEGPEGALSATPETIAVEGTPVDLLLARLSGGPSWDVVVAAGEGVTIVRGRDRRRRPGAAQIERIETGSVVRALASGDFVHEPGRELAILVDDDTVRLLAEERRFGASTWRTIERLELPESSVGLRKERPSLVALRITGSATEDLVVLDASRGRAHVLAAPFRSAAPRRLSLESGEGAVDALPLRLNADALPDLVIAGPATGGPLVLPTAAQATLTVTSAADNAFAGDGACTLREAIVNANANADTTAGDCAPGSGVDAIGFAILGGGAPVSIQLLSALPAITDPVTIDGTTQACASPPCVVLDGSLAGAVPAGLQVDAGSSTIRGLVIQRFFGVSGNPALNAYGIWLLSSGNVVEGNYCGTDLTGTVARSNDGAGVRIDDGSSNTIGGTTPGSGNVLSAAVNGAGVNIVGTSQDNEVLGNFIGTDVTGTIDLGNGSSGIGAQASSNTYGGTTAAARNVISANAGNGIFMPAPAQGNLIQGNHIGTDAGGSVALGNGAGFPAVWIDGSSNTVGSAAVGGGNLISGNPSSGVRLTGTGHDVLGNLIGTDATGSLDLGNTSVGVRVQGGQDNTIGGTTPTARNVISGNDSDGVFLGGVTQGNVVLGNYIGTDATGASGLANGLVGVEIDGDAFSNTIGGSSAGAGNVISGNAQGGIFVQLGKQNLIEGNRIGTDTAGTSALGNGIFSGIEIWDSGNTVGGTAPGAGNLISGNELSGVFFNGVDAHDNAVLGNLIGTDVTGGLALGNGFNGVEFQNASNNTVGGDVAGARNVISANELNGVHMAGASGISVLGNYIGTDAGGASALGNVLAGVRVVSSSGVTVGGAGAGAGNVVSGNLTVGVRIAGFSAQNNIVEGNYIGTDASGTSALGNLLAGVEIENASGNTIGGTVSGAGNVISGNGPTQGWGVALEGAFGNEIHGNFIGLAADGVSPVPNRLAGVGAAAGASDNAIGGTGVTPGRCDGPCNRIAFTSSALNDGVRILAGSGSGNAILGNSIHSSAELGIDLEGSGVSPNDPGDADAGANDVQNFPELAQVEATPTSATIDGTLESSPNRPFRIEFFANLACDASGHGEGARFLGFVDVTTDPGGTAAFQASVSGPVGDGEAVVATATNLSNSTSEFSTCATAVCLSVATFGQTLQASSVDELSWAVADDVLFAKGDLVDVATYVVTSTGELPGAVSLDISADAPSVGEGVYYVVRSLACGSWQTAEGAEPTRDTDLP